MSDKVHKMLFWTIRLFLVAFTGLGIKNAIMYIRETNVSQSVSQGCISCVVLGLAILMLAIVIFFGKKLLNATESTLKIVFVCQWIVLISFQILFIILARPMGKFDPSLIAHAAKIGVGDSTYIGYYQQYPEQLAITLIFKIWYGLLDYVKYNDILTANAFLAMMFCDIAVLFACRIVKRIVGEHAVCLCC